MSRNYYGCLSKRRLYGAPIFIIIGGIYMIFDLEIGAAILGLGVALTIVLIFIIIRDRRQGTQIDDQQYSRASAEIQRYSQPAHQPPSHQEAATPQSQTTSILCNDCGELNKHNAKFCVICGKKL